MFDDSTSLSPTLCGLGQWARGWGRVGPLALKEMLRWELIRCCQPVKRVNPSGARGMFIADAQFRTSTMLNAERMYIEGEADVLKHKTDRS